MSDQDIKDLLKPINGELVGIQLTQIPNLRKELVARLDAHGQDIARLKSLRENDALLLQNREKELVELKARIKKLEDSHSVLKPNITLPSLTKDGIKFAPEQTPKKWWEIISGK